MLPNVPSGCIVGVLARPWHPPRQESEGAARQRRRAEEAMTKGSVGLGRVVGVVATAMAVCACEGGGNGGTTPPPVNDSGVPAADAMTPDSGGPDGGTP